MTILIVIGAIVALVLLTALVLLFRYKKCPPDQLLIKSGAGKTISMNTASVVDKIDKDGNRSTEILPVPIDTSIKIYQGKGALILPLVQTFHRMSLKPYTITSQVMGPDNGFIDTYVDTALNTAVSGKPDLRLNAVSRFLTTERKEVEGQIKLILDGAIRHVIATMSIEELNNNRDKFLEQIKETLAPKLALLGFDILDINIQRIYDKVDFLNNLGKKKETEARANALADIAEKEKDGEIRKAKITRDQATQIASAKKEQETTVKETEKEQAVKIAQIEKDREIETATAINLKEVGKAEQEAEQRANVAAANARAEIAEAQADSDARAQVAQADANAEAAEAEATAGMEVRKAKAAQDQAAQTTQAIQDKEAREAEYKSKKDQRKAAAERDAGVAEQTAKIAVAEARAKAGQAEADADRISDTAKVEAEMAVEQTRQERQLKVNEAEAKAKEAKLHATEIVPAEKAKQRAVIDADAEKIKIIIAAEAQAESIRKQAQADADKIRMTKTAEAEGVKAVKLAEAEGLRASLMADADAKTKVGMIPAEVIKAMIAAGMTPEGIVQYMTVDHIEGIAAAQAQAFEHIHLGQVNVYGSENTAANFMTSVAEAAMPLIKTAEPVKNAIAGLFGGSDKKITDGKDHK